MYTIIMNNDKSLTASVKTTLYQHEKLADKIQFLFPQKYGDIDIADCTATIKYTNCGNIPYEKVLEKDGELYNNMVRFVFPVDTDFTFFAGDIDLTICFYKEDEDGNCTMILVTGEIRVTINPLPKYVFVPQVEPGEPDTDEPEPDDGNPDDDAVTVYTLDEVNDALNDSEVSTVKLGADISSEGNRVIVVNCGAEKYLDLAGYSIACLCEDETETTVAIHVRGGSTLNIVDSVGTSVVDGGEYAKYNETVVTIEDSTCNIFGGAFTCGAVSGSSSTTLYAEAGYINIYDGYFETRDWDDNDLNCVMNIKNNSGSTILCYGGTFADQNPADGDDRDTTTGATFLADGCTVEESEEDDRKFYTVVLKEE